MKRTEFISIDEWGIRTGLKEPDKTPNEKEFGVKLINDEDEGREEEE